MDVREKYKWAIELIKDHCGEAEVLVKEFDWGHGLAVALEQGERMAGLLLQRPLFEGQGEDRECVGLYQIEDNKEIRKAILDWIRRFGVTKY